MGDDVRNLHWENKAQKNELGVISPQIDAHKQLKNAV